MTAKRWIWVGAAVVVILAVIFFSRSGEEIDGRVLATVEPQDLSREISVSGTVIAAQDAALSFGVSGSVSSISFDVGSTVSAGTVIARLRNATKVAERDEAQAALEAAQAELDKLKKGATVEDRSLADAKVEKSQTAQLEAMSVLARELREAFTVAEDSVFNRVDQVFSNARAFPQLRVPGVSAQLKADVESGRRTLETNLDAWRLQVIGTSDDMVVEDVEVIRAYVETLVGFLTKISNVLAGGTSGGEISDTTIESWQASVAVARTNVDAARDAISDAVEALDAAEVALLVAVRERDLTYASATPEELAVRTARVNEASARVDRITADIEDTLLRAPFTGTIGTLNLSVGENVAARESVATIESSGALEIEAFVPEVDVALLEDGQAAKVTLDALGSSEIFNARVESIDQSATVREGVATYKTILRFDSKDPRIRTGMSANTDIQADMRESVLVVPGRAVIRKDGKDFVRLLKDDGSVEEVQIFVGLRGTFGDVEVVRGLEEGQTIVVREE